MGESADQALDRMPVGPPFALLPHMQALTLEIIMRVVFDISDRERLEELRPLLRRLLRLVTSHQAIPRYVFRRAGTMRGWRGVPPVAAQGGRALAAQSAPRPAG